MALLQPPASSESSGVPFQLQLRVSRLRMELLRLREAQLLAPTVAWDAGSEIMNLLLWRAQDNNSAGSSGQDQCLGDWMSVSCVLGDAGELLCIEHSLDCLARTAAVSLGHLVRDRSCYRVLEAEDLKAVSRMGTRAAWGYKALTLQRTAATQSAASAEAGTQMLAFALPVGAEVAGSGRLVYLASTSRQEFDELSDALSSWKLRFFSCFVDADEAKGLPMPHIPASHSDSVGASASATGVAATKHEAAALAGEIASLRREMDGLSDENMALWRRLIYAELRVWNPQDGAASTCCLDGAATGKWSSGPGDAGEAVQCASGGCRTCACSETVPRTQLEEAQALALVVEKEADRLRTRMFTALGLLNGIMEGCP